MSTLDLVQYYPNLLILQYVGKPRAYATVQTQVTPVIMPQTSTQEIAFAVAPTSGAFTLTYDGNATASINWNDSASTIQTKLQSVSGLSSVTVSGSISGLSLIVTFTGVTPPALLLALGANTLMASGNVVVPDIEETDESLPLAVQNGFNLIGDSPSVGVQLDVLGKYAGVSRSSNGFTAQITLDDADFLSLVRMAIIKNSAGSSLATIQDFIHQFFDGEMLVFDSKDMRMTYLISTSVGSQDLIQVFITEKILPVPMAVAVAVIYAPVITKFFSFRTYAAPTYNGEPFNNYSDYRTDWPWLSYADAVSA